MIIKVLSRHGGKDSIKKLVRYVFRDTEMAEPKARKRIYNSYGFYMTRKDLRHLLEEREDAKLLTAFRVFQERTGITSHEAFIDSLLSKIKQPFIVRKNLRSRTLNKLIAELEENGERRVHKRARQVALQHVIISWKPEDARHLSDKVLYDIANKFCELRQDGQKMPILGTKHEHGTDHTHLHILVAGTGVDGKSTRISKQRLATIKRELQGYQKEKYPALESLPEHGKKERLLAQGDRESWRKYKSDERHASKNGLFNILEQASGQSRTRDQFFDRLEKEGAVPYHRAGKLTGVVYEGLKFRFSRLGYTERLAELEARQEKEEKALSDLRTLRQGKQRSLAAFRTSADAQTRDEPEKGEKVQEDPREEMEDEIELGAFDESDDGDEPEDAEAPEMEEDDDENEDEGDEEEDEDEEEDDDDDDITNQ